MKTVLFISANANPHPSVRWKLLQHEPEAYLLLPSLLPRFCS